MPAATSQLIQANFTSVNPGAPRQMLADGQFATATNIDFGLIPGAAAVRRGCFYIDNITNASVFQIQRTYNNENFGAQVSDPNLSPFYAQDINGTFWRGSEGAWVAIASGGNGFEAGMNWFNNYTFIAAGANSNWKDDGTLTTEWVKQSPGAPTVVVQQISPIDLTNGGANSWTVSPGGTIGGAGGTSTFTNDPTLFSAQATMTFGGPINMDSNSGNTVGNFGVTFIDLAFSDPTQLGTVIQNWSIGDATFTNYFTAQVAPGTVQVDNAATPDANSLIDAQLAVGTGSGTALTPDTRAYLIGQIATSTAPVLSGLSAMSNVISPWGVGRTEFGMVGTYTGTDPWANIYAVQYIFQLNGTCTITAQNPAEWGAENFPLNAAINGYTWWQTYATLVNGLKVGEGAPSPPVGPVTMQMAQAAVALTGTATGTKHGINAVITYRQGGLMQTPYAVNTSTYTGTATFTDTINDIQAISQNYPLTINLQSAAYFNSASNVSCVSEPYADRLFYGFANYIGWSMPGVPDALPTTSYAQMGPQGDFVQSIIVWPPGIVIVNQNSVYEMVGTQFETNPDYVISRSASRHGSVAPKTCIKTPYGIPLLSYDGLTMFLPGQGVDTAIPWIDEMFGDMFKGNQTTDPAVRKGSRIPAINYAYITRSCAAFMNDRLYMACPTGSSAATSTVVFVFDFTRKAVWWYVYPNELTDLFWDYQYSRLLAVDASGNLYALETGEIDYAGSSKVYIPWYAETKDWSVPTETVSENIKVEAEGANGGPGIKVLAVYDNATGTAVGTLTNSTRQWNSLPMNGSFANSVYFQFQGTYTNSGTAAPWPLQAVYQLSFELMPEPPQVQYLKTPYDMKGYEGDKLWDVAYFDLECRQYTGNTTAVTFVDSTAVMTNTFTGTFSRSVFESSFPSEIYGRVAYTTYSATGTTTFKQWDTYYDARQEPAKINYYHTDWQSLEENICDAFDVDINPNGTVTGTCFVDNVAQATATFVGVKRQSFTYKLAEELYGRTLYVEYTGTGFKHYKTWFHLRQEPDRWTNYVTNKVSLPEHEWKIFNPELDCLGNTVLATAWVDDLAVGTYTITGSGRERYSFSLPPYIFGRTVWASYAAVSGVFKHYVPNGLSIATRDIEFQGDQEPDRVTQYRTGPYPFPASQYLKTWLPLIDPGPGTNTGLDNAIGTVTGTLTVDDQVLTTATFTGNKKQWFTYGLDLNYANAIQTGSRYEVLYSASTPFKHYETKMETETKPFGKNTWVYSYRKLGGASQVDLARFWAFELEGTNTPQEVAYFWDIDGTNFTYGTVTLSATGIQWMDRIAFPPGGRGRIFLFRSQSPDGGNYKVYQINLDLDQEGIKGLVRREVPGTPDDKQSN